MRRRIAVGIEYEGSAYSGWQIQSAAPSVQAALETALSRVADEPLALTCAGGTVRLGEARRDRHGTR